MLLEVKNLGVNYGKKQVLYSIDFGMGRGEILAVLGSNGAGKTTLFRTIMSFLKPNCGKVLLNGKDVQKLSKKELSKIIAYVPQCHNCAFSFSVLELVVMGRNPHIGAFSEPKEKDFMLAMKALEKLNIEHLAKRRFRKLSGGEKQLVLIARALVQTPMLIIMDEPTASLDYNNSINVLSQVIKLKDENLSLIITCHSPRQARVFADKVLMIKDGTVFKKADASILDKSDVLHDLYNINIEDIDNERIKNYITKTA